MNELRTYVRLVLREAAKTVEQATQEELALIVDADGKQLDIILYNPSRYHAELAARVRTLQGLKKDVTYDSVFEPKMSVGDFILGFIRMGPPKTANPKAKCWGADTIWLSAAAPGYGPMMYDAALTFAPSGMLAPDRDEVSSAAASVWNYYHKNRSDVVKKPFDDLWNPRTPPPEDDCIMHDDPALDAAYVLRSSSDVKQLQTSHRKAMGIILPWLRDHIMDVTVDHDDLKGEIIDAAEAYFRRRYDES